MDTPTRLRVMAELHNVSRQDIARLTGTHPVTVTRWATGARRITPERIRALYAALAEVAVREAAA